MRVRVATTLAAVALTIVAMAADAPQADTLHWGGFRGPHGQGVAHGVALPTVWNADQNVFWKVKLPGIGWSQPVVWGNRIFVTTAVADDQGKPRLGESGSGFSFFSREGFARAFGSGGAPPDIHCRWQVLCLDGSDGSIIWEKLAKQGRPPVPIHRSNSYASETPVTDGERLYVYLGMTGLLCYDLAGELLWSHEIDAFPMQYGWGTGSSPVLVGERLILACDNEKKSFLLAVDKRTGKEIWRVDRDEDSNWSTPFLWQNRVRDELVVAGGTKVRSYQLADGQILWERIATGRTATTPVGNADLVYVGSVTRSQGGSGELVAVRAGAKGELADGDPSIAWVARSAAPELASPLLYEGYLYVCHQHGGIVSCFDAQTGKRQYRKRLQGASGFTSSPLANQGRIFFPDEKGSTHVVAAGPELEVLHTNLLDEMMWSSPAVIGERLLLRGVDHLFCIGD